MGNALGLKERAIWTIPFILTIALVTPVTGETLTPFGKPGRGVSHTAKQMPPIQLGTSGGWTYDLANGYCCGGTLGSLVRDEANNYYILSNFHVLAADVAPGGNDLIAQEGDPIIQPGLIDVGCNQNNAQAVATLSQWADPLTNANIDAALALINPGQVRTDGAILEIGTISNSTRAPSLNLAVKKSGRTTRLTSSRITGLSATISVSYDTECAGSLRGTAIFVNQIVVSNRGSKFLAGGDSGSLMVEDVTSNPRAVGLLYAGSSSVAIANPIDEVLCYFSTVLGKSVAMVGGAGIQGAEVPVAAIEDAKKIKARHAARLENVPRGVGHGIGLGHDGRIVIKVYVEEDTPEVRAAVPDSIDGMPVEIEETGRIIPLSRCR
ncbi:MAG: hypothetical protein A2157_14395 [Deltaproteobacteria bacterium RBG_16_47_11]|nr:MAG: hypothetical protein A2157_14395 [Deltaproteobacteria bacterium RBG_16_47_11]